MIRCSVELKVLICYYTGVYKCNATRFLLSTSYTIISNTPLFFYYRTLSSLIIIPAIIVDLEVCPIPIDTHVLGYSCRHFSNACSADSLLVPQRSPIILHVLFLMIFSTAISFRRSNARLSVRPSRGKYRELYGSSLSSTTRSLALASSICRCT